MWWERYSYSSYCVSGLRCKRLKKLPRSLDSWSHLLPSSAFPGSAWRASARRGQRGQGGQFRILLPPACISLDNWIIPRLSGFEPGGRGFWMRREGSRVGLTEGRGAQWMQAWLSPGTLGSTALSLTLHHLTDSPQTGQRFLPTSCSSPCLLRGANYLAC